MKTDIRRRIAETPVLGKIIINLMFGIYRIVARTRESFPNIVAVLLILLFVATAVFSLSFPQKMHTWVWTGISYFGAGVVIVASIVAEVLAIVFVAIGFILVGITTFLVFVTQAIAILITALLAVTIIWGPLLEKRPQ